ncbi:MAG: gamma-glutamyl-gamma-aminobutyrate hydrolase family protein [Planctomycetota bacterium]|nr:gamma-glutamyl-gamma-aminobutyrate hydrolase family protein [Planctomycetota bacterium]MDA1105435.1 gamma-glutamyl-gamma-aminobutyrate hydrolase family protein [Planctomycetota bacterium]
MPAAPLIGITADLAVNDVGRLRHQVNDTYIQCVARAGGVPIVLPAITEVRLAMMDMLDGIVLTGGDDIDMRPFGVPLHERAKCMHPQRQGADFALLAALEDRPDLAVLGICLGMQQMGVHAGCRLIQHLHDEVENGDRHVRDSAHPVATVFGDGSIASWHHQVLAEPGPFHAVGHSDDGLLEAIRHRDRPFYVGVQWHPERTDDDTLGIGMFRLLVEAAAASVAAR